MFEHSIKVPRLYKAAAKIAKETSENGTSLKQLVYEAKHVNLKGIYALAAQTTKRKDALDYVIRKSKILEKETRLDPWLCRVLITELLWGKKQLPGEAKPVKTVLAYKQVLSAHCADGGGEKEEEEAPTVVKPKYVRVNTLKATVEEIIDLFRDEGWTFVRHFEDKNYDNFLSKVANLGPEEFMLDLHVKELLVFPPKTEFHYYSFYKDGRIMIQDKASCLPAILLNPQPGSIVMDMCAAPGMKTTQMAALMKNEGTMYAVEFNTKRYESLNKMVESAGATCVKTINRDVIALTSRDFQDVEYILVDPSCSGSGMVDRLDFDTKINVDRLDKLAGFQIKILKTALHRFPKAKRIVYSTCSLYTQENEAVVKEVLASSLKYKLVPADQYLSAPWNNFGSPKYDDIGKFSLYARPEKDYTNGFYVAVFERLEEGEENPFIVVDLERKPRKRKGVEEDVEIVSVVKVGKDKRKDKNKKNKSVEEDVEIVSVVKVGKDRRKDKNMKNKSVEQNGNENHQNGIKKHKKKNSESIEIIDVITIEDNSEQIGRNGEKDIHENGVDTTKKKKKRKSDAETEIFNISESIEISDVITIEDNSEQIGSKEKKESIENGIATPKKKKKRKHAETELESFEISDVISIEDNSEQIRSKEKKEINENGTDTPKKKKKRKHADTRLESFEVSDVISIEGNSEQTRSKEKKEIIENGVDTSKKKKRKHVAESELESIEINDVLSLEDNSEQSEKRSREANEDGVDTTKKKKKKKHVETELESIEISDAISIEDNSEEIRSKDKKEITENGVDTPKKKKRKHVAETEIFNISESIEMSVEDTSEQSQKKNKEANEDGLDTTKKKKRKHSAAANESIVEELYVNGSSFVEDGNCSTKTKHKKKEKDNLQSDILPLGTNSNPNETIENKKRKRRKSTIE